MFYDYQSNAKFLLMRYRYIETGTFIIDETCIIPPLMKLNIFGTLEIIKNTFGAKRILDHKLVGKTVRLTGFLSMSLC